MPRTAGPLSSGLHSELSGKDFRVHVQVAVDVEEGHYLQLICRFAGTQILGLLTACCRRNRGRQQRLRRIQIRSSGARSIILFLGIHVPETEVLLAAETLSPIYTRGSFST